MSWEGAGGETKGSKGFCADNRDPNAWFELTNHEIT